MVSTELINTLKRLDRSSQIYVMQILLQELAENFKESESQAIVNKEAQETQQKRSPSVVSNQLKTPEFQRQMRSNSNIQTMYRNRETSSDQLASEEEEL
ncbi:hypothetical protein [Pseudanabaena sp. ABRG5-3]|uniref:hypothetical protein n=1 Tax=Pseudanabaena sp. ABRG5-3 TaxID=685565 RepID=UPI000DC73FD8|nr:hypothetical protein [Pseudanabaena sp. ABRG5-3]BBC24581.1 hypothetical protein ABRG53_2324 [Pseudanabaena sp. ABRG5-3]